VLGLPLEVRDVGSDYLTMLRYPRFGYGKGINPCVDCRIYMCRMAGRMMEEVGAVAVVTGEVLGQRPMSQRRPDLDAVAKHSGLKGRLLRPLSAKLLDPTIPERDGLIDRERLHAFSGRTRRPLLDLADQYGIPALEGPSTGCPLTEPLFAPKVRDLFEHAEDAGWWEFTLLRFGLHYRLDRRTKIVIGRNAEENGALRSLALRSDSPPVALLESSNFAGPDAIVVGEVTESAIETASRMMAQRGRASDTPRPVVRVRRAGQSYWVTATRGDGGRQADRI
jgi:tRNA(Ile)-lysidine synthase TilS/MesJ